MEDVLKESEARMQKALEPLKQLGQIGAPEPRMLVVTPYDKNASQSIEKAILASDLGINPRIEGGLIRLTLPELSEERRKDLTKVIKKELEEAKVAMRNVRREAIEALKKQKADKKITEDEEKGKDKKVQELIDKYSAEADKLLAAKEKEILEV